MSNVPMVGFPGSGLQDAVLKVVSGYDPRDAVSTRCAIARLRALAPKCILSDDALVDLIVLTAIGQTKTVVFDHRDPGTAIRGIG